MIYKDHEIYENIMLKRQHFLKNEFYKMNKYIYYK